MATNNIAQDVNPQRLARRGVSLWTYTNASSQLLVVLKPTARELGLNPEFFTSILSKASVKDLSRSVEKHKFHPAVFNSTEPFETRCSGVGVGSGKTQPGCLPPLSTAGRTTTPLNRLKQGAVAAGTGKTKRHTAPVQPDPTEPFETRCSGTTPVTGRGAKTYQCLPVEKLEALLLEIDPTRVRNPATKETLLRLRKVARYLVEKYFHEGGVVNKHATAAQVEKLAGKLEKIKLRLAAEKEARQAVEKAKRELQAKATAAVRHWKEEARTSKAHAKQVAAQLGAVIAECRDAVDDAAANAEAAIQLAEQSIADLRTGLKIPDTVPVEEFAQYLRRRVQRKVHQLTEAEAGYYQQAAKAVLQAARAGAAFHPAVWTFLAAVFPDEDVARLRRRSSAKLAQLAQPEVLANLVPTDVMRAYLDKTAVLVGNDHRAGALLTIGQTQ